MTDSAAERELVAHLAIDALSRYSCMLGPTIPLTTSGARAMREPAFGDHPKVRGKAHVGHRADLATTSWLSRFFDD